MPSLRPILVPGLRTFVDPRLGGGRLNARSTEALVRVMQIEGEEWLFYKAFPITVAFIQNFRRRLRRRAVSSPS